MPLPPPAVHADGAQAPLLAGGAEGAAALRPLTGAVIGALEEGALRRGGPLPCGGPRRVAAGVEAALGGGGAVPEYGTDAHEALGSLVRMVAAGAADPADPLHAAHPHCSPLAVAAAADLAASALDPSLDSWGQPPAASETKSRTRRALAAPVYGEALCGGEGHEKGGDGKSRGGSGGSGGGGALPDALTTTGGTEPDQLGVLPARVRLGPDVHVVCGTNAHHGVHRAAWLPGLPEPLRVPGPGGTLSPEALRAALSASGPGAPVLVVATAGRTDAGVVVCLPELADVAGEFGARLHVDAAYGGMLLFSRRLRSRSAGLERAGSVPLDLHKLGRRTVAAGVSVVPDWRDPAPPDPRAGYLNACDGSDAGLPDLLGRSLRTTRRPDVLKVAVTLRAPGRSWMAAPVERTCALTRPLAELVSDDPLLELFAMPELPTVLFRPAGADGAAVASVRRRLPAEGRAVLGRADPDGGAGQEGCTDQSGPGGRSWHGGRDGGGGSGALWLTATLLDPYAGRGDLESLLALVHHALPSSRPAPLPNRPNRPNRTPADPSPSSPLPRQAPATSIFSTARSHPS